MPLKSLTKFIHRSPGRSHGQITIRHRGGGHRRLYRKIDFVRYDKKGIPARVVAIEYDPNRSSRIALLAYRDGERRYILQPEGLKVDATVICDDAAEPKIGNSLRLKNMPLGAQVHAIEMQPASGAKLVRSAGASAQVLAQLKNYTQLVMPSKEVRLLHGNCLATMGVLSNPDHALRDLRKAGRSRWLGWRPTVRGKVMNPVDHPHGGGEGRTTIGLTGPKTPWGKPARGVKTRPKKPSSRFIIKRRR